VEVVKRKQTIEKKRLEVTKTTVSVLTTDKLVTVAGGKPCGARETRTC